MRRRILAIALAAMMSLTSVQLGVKAEETADIASVTETTAYESETATEHVSADDYTETENEDDGNDAFVDNYEEPIDPVLIQNLAAYTTDGSVIGQDSFDKGIIGVNHSMPSAGDITTLVIPVQFEDYKLDENIVTTLEKNFFAEADENSEYYPYESVHAYYERSSYGKLNITGDVIPVITLPHNREYYESDGNFNSDVVDALKEYILGESDATDTESQDECIDEFLSKYDSNDDKILDGLYICYAGGVENIDSIWWSYVQYFGGTEIGSYALGSACDLGDFKAPNTAIHETGHILGLGDYYLKQSGISAGIEAFDMQGHNGGDQNPFSKLLLGWISPDDVTIIKGGIQNVELSEYTESGQCVIVVPDYDESRGLYTEFYIADFRGYVGNDTYDWVDSENSKGICVYYVNATLNDSGDDFLHHNNSVDDAFSPLIREIHADGNEMHLSTVYGAPYNSTFGMCTTMSALQKSVISLNQNCFYKEGDELTPYTNPSSGAINGKPDNYTGFVLKNIKLENGKATFDIGIESEKSTIEPSYKLVSSNENTADAMVNISVELAFDTDVKLAQYDSVSMYEYAIWNNRVKVIDDEGEEVATIPVELDMYTAGSAKIIASSSEILEKNKSYKLVIPEGTFVDTFGNPVQEIEIPYSTNMKFDVNVISDLSSYGFGNNCEMVVDENSNGVFINGGYNEGDVTKVYLIKDTKVDSSVELAGEKVGNVIALWKDSESVWGLIYNEGYSISNPKNRYIIKFNSEGEVISKETLDTENTECGVTDNGYGYYISGNDCHLFKDGEENVITVDDIQKYDQIMWADEDCLIISFGGYRCGIFMDGIFLKEIKYENLDIEKIQRYDDRFYVLAESKVYIYDSDFELIAQSDLNKTYREMIHVDGGFIFGGTDVDFYDEHFNFIDSSEGTKAYDFYAYKNGVIYSYDSLGIRLMTIDGSSVEYPSEYDEHTKTYEVKQNEVAATCTDDGSYEAVEKCALCGERIGVTEKIIPATGHDWKMQEKIVADGESYIEYKCDNCNEVKKELLVSSVGLDKETVKLACGEETSIKATVAPTDAANKTLIWTSDDEDVATVDSTGKVSAVGAGTAIITCAAEDGSGIKATCEVTVTIPVTKVNLSSTALSLIKGHTSTLAATVMPDNATDKTVVWESSDTSVATVSSAGEVTAVGAGSATITATTKDGNKTATCHVTVVDSTTESPVTTENPVTTTETPATTENPVATTEAPATTEKPAVTTEAPATTEKPAATTEVPATTEKPAATTEAPATTERPAATTETAKIVVTKVTLDKNKLSLKTGGKSTLKATVYPDDASNSDVTWSSDKPSVATVDKNGKVTAKKAGTATITCTAEDGSGKKATCKVTVTDVKVKKITLSNTSVLRGQTVTLKVKSITPSNATNKKVTWSSSDKSIATVDKNGKVTAKKKGNVTITCTAADGSKTKATCKVTVKQPVTKITLSKTKVTLKKGKTITLKKTIAPSSANTKTVIWKSSNKKVATVDSNGKVKAVGKGTATITCTAKDGSGKKATCKVTVTK